MHPLDISSCRHVQSIAGPCTPFILAHTGTYNPWAVMPSDQERTQAHSTERARMAAYFISVMLIPITNQMTLGVCKTQWLSDGPINVLYPAVLSKSNLLRKILAHNEKDADHLLSWNECGDCATVMGYFALPVNNQKCDNLIMSCDCQEKANDVGEQMYVSFYHP